MLTKAKLFRRHNERCNNTHSPHLAEGTLDKCGCNLGYKGVDPTTKTFRRLMFDPPITIVDEGWRELVKKELGKSVVAAPVQSGFAVIHGSTSNAGPQQRVTVAEAWEKYLVIVQTERNVRESSIYSMFRRTGKGMMGAAEERGIKYLHEIGYDFPSLVLSRWTHLSEKVSRDYRFYMTDFFRVARKKGWIDIDPCERLEIPRPGRLHNQPEHPTEPFTSSDDAKVLAAIPQIVLPYKYPERDQHFTHTWRANPVTGKAYLYTLYYTGLRKGDALAFEPRSLEKRTVIGDDGKNHEVYVRWVPKQKKTDAPVFVVVPYQIGEFIKAAPRLSEEFAFIPRNFFPPKSKGHRFQSWRSWVTGVYQLFDALETASGVPHIHAHRFRDSFAVRLLQSDADIRFVSRALGHSSVAVTIAAYEHFIPEDQLNAVKVMLRCHGI